MKRVGVCRGIFPLRLFAGFAGAPEFTGLLVGLCTVWFWPGALSNKADEAPDRMRERGGRSRGAGLRDHAEISRT
jgi:hypothetical protein